MHRCRVLLYSATRRGVEPGRSESRGQRQSFRVSHLYGRCSAPGLDAPDAGVNGQRRMTSRRRSHGLISVEGRRVCCSTSIQRRSGVIRHQHHPASEDTGARRERPIEFFCLTQRVARRRPTPIPGGPQHLHTRLSRSNAECHPTPPFGPRSRSAQPCRVNSLTVQRGMGLAWLVPACTGGAGSWSRRKGVCWGSA